MVQIVKQKKCPWLFVFDNLSITEPDKEGYLFFSSSASFLFGLAVCCT